MRERRKTRSKLRGMNPPANQGERPGGSHPDGCQPDGRHFVALDGARHARPEERPVPPPVGVDLLVPYGLGGYRSLTRLRERYSSRVGRECFPTASAATCFGNADRPRLRVSRQPKGDENQAQMVKPRALGQKVVQRSVGGMQRDARGDGKGERQEDRPVDLEHPGSLHLHREERRALPIRRRPSRSRFEHY